MTCIKPKFFLKILLLTSIFFLNGCSSFVWNSHGIIAREECFLIFISFLMMLLIIVPVIFMTLYFSKKYQCNNKDQIYAPNWCHSNKIEMIIWFIPIMIILFLSFLSWNYTHKLEPKKSISSFYQPIKIDVISLNWKWFFIYPDYHIATINEIVIPINRPIIFRITSNSVMNSFFIPSLGSQIYAMPGMITKLNLISDHTGIFKGISSNYSGRGFSDMKFTVNSVSDNVMFHQWIKKIKNSKNTLNMFKKINIISEIEKHCLQRYFSGIDKNLFDQVANQYSIKNFFIIH